MEKIECRECGDTVESGFTKLEGTFVSYSKHTEMVAEQICTECVKTWIKVFSNSKNNG